MRGGSRSMASVLQEKSKVFALQIIKVCNEIKQEESNAKSIETGKIALSHAAWGESRGLVSLV